MILSTIDPSGQKKYFAGYYRDNSICWTSAEQSALDKGHYIELKTVAARHKLENYNIREVISAKPLFAS